MMVFVSGVWWFCTDEHLNLVLFLQLCHQLGVLVAFRSVRRQRRERQQGHPVVRHVIG